MPATFPAADPVHAGLSRSQLLGYIADALQSVVTGAPATLPTSAPVHSGLSPNQLLGFIADSLQPV